MTASVAAACGGCRWFDTGPIALEESLPGLSSLSSAHASSRDTDGYCRRHARFLRATAWCSGFSAA